MSCHIHPQLTPDISSRRVIKTNDFPSELCPPAVTWSKPSFEAVKGGSSRCRGRHRDQKRAIPTSVLFWRLFAFVFVEVFKSKSAIVIPARPESSRAEAGRLPPLKLLKLHFLFSGKEQGKRSGSLSNKCCKSRCRL